MTSEQIVALILASLTAGGVGTKLIDWARDAVSGHLKERRAEVDRAIAEREKEHEAREAAEDAEAEQARRVRVLEESIAIHRHVIITAPCLGPEALPEYPARRKE